MQQDNPPYIYVVVRTDIPLADQMVQVGHACHISGYYFGAPDNCHLVLCQIKDEQSLDAIHDYMHEHGIRHVMFEEDKDDMGWTSLCTEPITDKRPLLSHLRLWRPKKPLWKKIIGRVAQAICTSNAWIVGITTGWPHRFTHSTVVEGLG